MGDPVAERTSEGPVEWGQTLLWLLLLALPLAFSARTTESFELPKTAFLVAAAILLAAGAIGVALTGGRPLPSAPTRMVRDPISLGVVLWLASAGVSTVRSVSPLTSVRGAEGSYAGLVTVSAYVVVFFAFRALVPDPGAARGVWQGGLIGLGATVAYGLLQQAGLDPVHWEAPVVYGGTARVFATLGHPNSLAQLLAMGLPVVMVASAAAYRGRRSGEALALGGVAIGSLALLALTLSRAGALALLVGLLVLAIGSLRIGHFPRRRAALAAIALLALLGGGLLVAIRFDGGAGVDQMKVRLTHTPGAGVVAGDPRGPMWAAALRIFQDHPVTGSGLETLSLVYGRYRTPEGWASEWGQTPRKAHNQGIDLLATRGVVGFAAVLVIVAGVQGAARRVFTGVAAEPWLCLAAIAGLSAFAAHNLFHFPNVATTTFALAWLALLSNAAAPSMAEPVRGPSRGVLFYGALVVGAALVYAVVIRPLQADRLIEAGTIVTTTDPARAAALASAAVALDPTRELLWTRRSAAYQAVARATADPAARREAFAEARRSAERGLGLCPMSAYAHAHLGTLLADLEREVPPLATRAETQAAFARAHALDPVNADVLQAAAAAALAAGALPDATAWASQAASLYPGFGPPRAILGAVALSEGRSLAGAGHAEEARTKALLAASLLEEALAGDWRGDLTARETAATNLRAAEGDARRSPP